jgi:site-specific DNA recombinase
MTTPTGSAPRYAWYGRVSTEDEQDPTLSFPRQLQNAERQVAEVGGRIVSHYYDIESGTRAYAARGSGGLAGFDIPIPRDGGLQDLLADAARHPARFDRVIVESISRLSRNSSVAFRVEDELRQAGVRLCAADEPQDESFGTIVLRHVNIGIARGYHHELMVKSRQGQETSTRQGWHTGGVALYGYRFTTHDHPNPHKASRGQSKRTLELDPVRAPVVRAIYDWYLGGGMGLLQIRDRLNAEPERYAPPVPVDPATARGAWSRSSVWEVLRNPKYTGFQVWNRRARKKGHNRTNPPGAWIWSEEPAHPAIVSREEYDAVQLRARANERSRQAVPATVARPTAKRNYLYRGLIHCGICGLRMWGNHGRRATYYSCQPSHQRSKDIPADHPSHVYLNEQRLNSAVLPFLAAALFGPERTGYWRTSLDAAAEPENAAPVKERAAEIEAEIADLERRLTRQLVNLEAGDVTPALRRRVGQRVSELEDAIAERRERLVALAREAAAEAPTLADVAPLLDRLPILATSLDSAPQSELRALFDVLQLDVTYQPAEGAVDVAVTLYDGGGDTGAVAAQVRAEDWSRRPGPPPRRRQKPPARAPAGRRSGGGGHRERGAGSGRRGGPSEAVSRRCEAPLRPEDPQQRSSATLAPCGPPEPAYGDGGPIVPNTRIVSLTATGPDGIVVEIQLAAPADCSPGVLRGWLDAAVRPKRRSRWPSMAARPARGLLRPPTGQVGAAPVQRGADQGRDRAGGVGRSVSSRRSWRPAGVSKATAWA